MGGRRGQDRSAGLPVIVLGAGRGRRLGGPKLLAMHGGRGFLQRILDRCAETASPVTLTLAPETRAAAEALLRQWNIRDAWPQPALVETDPAGDMLSSLQAALRAAPHPPGAWVWPVDAPFISAAGWRAAAEEAAADPERVLLLRSGGRGGHPLWLPASLHPAVLSGRWDNGLAGLIQGLAPGQVRRLELPGEQLRDVNTPEDLPPLKPAE